ncbi:uncharacterized protein yc1106_06617 [Curvularia clavata]|uniref:Uncharacterized protein n=1 Tax=Curvularia clavata TaxID=95742 RepID=A0A9Q9DT28_CURCL|nr:uncharacterized protein yc1106_06617 [Curvularia clavata]
MARRRPPVLNFDYNNMHITEKSFFEGFGIEDENTRAKIKARRKRAFLEVNPRRVTYHGADGIKVSAITYMITQSRTAVNRSKQTHQSSQSCGDKRRREGSASDSEDVDKTRMTKKRPRRHPVRKIKYESDENDDLQIVPSIESRPYRDSYRESLPEHGVIEDEDIITEIGIEELSTGSIVSLEKLASIARSLVDYLGFVFSPPQHGDERFSAWLDGTLHHLASRRSSDVPTKDESTRGGGSDVEHAPEKSRRQTPVKKPHTRETIDLTVDGRRSESPTRHTGGETLTSAPANPDFGIDGDLEEDQGPEEDQGLEVDAEANARAEEDAIQYALSSRTAITAKASAARTNLDIYKRAARTFGMELNALRPTQEQCRIVGATEAHIDAFSSKRGCVLADEIGFGKTHTSLRAWKINFDAVVKTHSTNPTLEELYFPPMEDGKVNSIKPRIGATFISASPRGLKAWPQAWSRMMGSSKALLPFPANWRPKLVILHGDGQTYAQEFGGHASGIYWTMTQQDWAEVLPKPDWNNSREPIQPPHKELEWEFTGTSNWPESPGATTSRPAPTSTQYVIVSTNNSWRNYITCTWTPDNKYKNLQRYLQSQTNEKGWVVVDELHAAGSEHTLTYTEVVNVFRTGRPKQAWPGVIGITGSALANGIDTTTAFAVNAIKRSKPKDKAGETLKLINATHDIRYEEVQFEDEYHQELVDVEEQVKATVEEKWKEAKREWEEKNRPGEEPLRPALDRADPRAYVNARILASFPNLLKAIQAWQDEHPDEPRIVGEGLQAGNRQYRIGQQQPRVEVKWLVHKDSYIETKIARKNKATNRFADRVKGATVKDIRALADEGMDQMVA